MATIIKYASDIDGKLFDSEQDQIAYDTGLRNDAQVEAFLDREYPKPTPGTKGGASRGIAKKAIVAWLGYMANLKIETSPAEEPTI